jgi:hypothetical protein
MNNALFGEDQESHEYLYWDYGHVRERYNQALRMGNWIGVRFGKDPKLELYNLASDTGEPRTLQQTIRMLSRVLDNLLMTRTRRIIHSERQQGPLARNFAAELAHELLLSIKVDFYRYIRIQRTPHQHSGFCLKFALRFRNS